MPRHDNATALKALGPLLIAIALQASLIGPVLAQQMNDLTTEQRDACTADFKRLCPGQMPGGGRVKQCFAEHFEELSPTCQEAVAASGAVEQAPPS